MCFARIAQLVEHFIRNEKVMGSSPISGSKKVVAPLWQLLFLPKNLKRDGKWLRFTKTKHSISTNWLFLPIFTPK